MATYFRFSFDFITKYTEIFCWKNGRSFCNEKASHIFKQKYWHFWDIRVWNVDEKFTNDIISFEQLNPAVKADLVLNCFTHATQGINESPCFHFLQRLSYLASAGTVRDLLLPVETTVREKWLPAETVSVILLPAETRQEAKSQGQSVQEAISQAQQSQQEARDRGQSRRKPNMTDSLCRERKLAD